MKKAAISLGFALVMAGCSMSSEEDRLENSMREELTKQGNVQEVEMVRENENSMTGHAVVRRASDSEGRRLDCSAQRDPSKGTAYYNWRCQPSIDETMLTETENSIRQSLSSQGEVQEVEMTRRDADNMAGFARVRDGAGNEGRFSCTAARNRENVGNFDWNCLPPGAAPAEAGGEGEGGK